MAADSRFGVTALQEKQAHLVCLLLRPVNRTSPKPAPAHGDWLMPQFLAGMLKTASHGKMTLNSINGIINLLVLLKMKTREETSPFVYASIVFTYRASRVGEQTRRQIEMGCWVGGSGDSCSSSEL